MFIIPSTVAELDSIVLAYNEGYKTASDLGSLWSNINNLYHNIRPQSVYEKHILETNGIGHVTNVVNNVKLLYGILNKEPSEEALAAAMCHDLGYLIHLFDASQDYRNVDIGENHHIYSARIVETYLKNFGFSESQISRIAGIVIAHDEGPSYGTEEENIVFIADKLTRLGEGGLERICASRGYNPSNIKKALEILDEVEKIMGRTYADLKELGIASEYIEKEYIEGKRCLEERRKALKRYEKGRNNKNEEGTSYEKEDNAEREALDNRGKGSNNNEGNTEKEASEDNKDKGSNEAESDDSASKAE